MWARARLCRGEFISILQLRLRLLQPVRHVHLAIHRGRGGEVLPRLLALARAPVELAEAEVAVGHGGAHAELGGERQRRSMERLRLVEARARVGNFCLEVDDPGLEPTLMTVARQRKRTTCDLLRLLQSAS